MNKLLIIASVISLTALVFSDAQTDSGTLVITVSGLRNNKGKVIAAIFKDSNGFPDDRSKSVQQVVALVNENISFVEFRNLPYGSYAIGIIHDENNNGTMDFGLFHIPKEGFGASNNAKGHWGPPDFNDARFIFSPGNNTIKIQINY